MGRIDTHHHYVPPAYRRYLEGHGFSGGQPVPAWAPEASLATMDDLGVDTAVLSVARPGFPYGGRAGARDMARAVNEHAADLVREHPSRFGFFAALPLPDVADAVDEARHALDHLESDGVVLLGNVAGTYLGDPALDPLMAELDARRAVVFVHPNAVPAEPLADVPVFVADFLLDTTRAALNLVRHGVLRRFPGIRFLLAHGGGFLPYASHRVASLTPVSEHGPQTPEEFLEDCSLFYLDTALTISPHSLPSLLAFARPGHLTFGSDWPYAPGRTSWWFTDLLTGADLDEQVRASIDRGAAETLFPRLVR